MASYQDIETRLRAVERKTDYIMRNFKFGRVNPITGQAEQIDMLKLYYEQSQLEEFNAKEVADKLVRASNNRDGGQASKTPLERGPEDGDSSSGVGEKSAGILITD
jgi:hypothetical protein